MNDVNRKMAAGIAWMSLMRMGIKGLGVVSTVVLARLLAPADFGLVAMAMSVVAALQLLQEFSFDVALIQRQDADRSYYDTAWTLNVLFSVSLGVILLLVAAPTAQFYDEPRLTSVMCVLAVGVVVSGFENVGVIAFLKDLTYHKEFLLRFAQKSCSIAITIPLAFVLRSYWALVVGMVSGYALRVLISYYAHPFRPRFSLAAYRHLFSFSQWLLANNVLGFLRRRFPDFVLGRLAGPSSLGLFTISQEISNLPTTELVAPINRAVFPAYAKMANNRETLRNGFLNVIGLVVLVALPAGFGIAAVSELLVTVALGEQWLPAIPVVAVLAAYGAINALTTNCTAVYFATGQPRTLVMIGLTQAAFLIPSLIWGALNYGVTGVAWAYVANSVVVTVPLNYAVMLKRLELRLVRVLSVMWRPSLATAVMYYLVSRLAAQLGTPTLQALLATVAFGAAVYISTVMALWLIARRPDGPERTIVNRAVLPAWRRFAARAT